MWFFPLTLIANTDELQARIKEGPLYLSMQSSIFIKFIASQIFLQNIVTLYTCLCNDEKYKNWKRFWDIFYFTKTG